MTHRNFYFSAPPVIRDSCKWACFLVAMAILSSGVVAAVLALRTALRMWGFHPA